MNLNFELNIIRDAWFEEYKALRDEIIRRVQLQTQIIAFIILISGAGIPLVFKIIDSGSFVFFLLISSIYFIVGWLYYEQDIFITQAATYLNNILRQNIIKCLNDKNIKDKFDKESIFSWEIFRNKILFGKLKSRLFIHIMTYFRILATSGPGLTAILGFIYYASINPSTKRSWTSIELFLLLFDILLAFIVIITAFRVILRYRRIKTNKVI